MKAWFFLGVATWPFVTGCWDPLTLGTDPSGAGGGGGAASSASIASSAIASSSAAAVVSSSSAGTGGTGGGGAGGGDAGGPFVCDPPAPPGSIYEFSMQPLDGTVQPVSMCEYRGKVLLIANTAAKCAYTPQYAGLQGVHSLYEPQGLEVLGYYSNDFGMQAGTPDEIEMCNSQYSVTFDQFGIFVVTEVTGQHPLFYWLTHQPGLEGPVTYNFNKFLVARDGTLVNRWPETVEPTSMEVVNAIMAEIAKPFP